MELTQNERARIFGSYLLCEVEYQSALKLPNNGKGTLLSVCSYTGELLVNMRGTQDNDLGHLSTANLILKPLYEISDVDAIEVGRIHSGECSSWQFGKGVVKLLFSNPKALDFSANGIIETIDYLRSKGYMIPYKGQSLFDLNIAKKEGE